MKRLSSKNLLLYVLHLCLYANAILLIPTIGEPEKPVAFFIFGDSILDVGNNVYINTTIGFRSNFLPYGETFFHYPTGRASDGRLICDFIAEYAKLPLIPPYQKAGAEFYDGANFASGGAGALVETYQGFVIDLKTQLRNFKKVNSWLIQKLGDVEAKKKISRAVYLISISSNDYLTPFFTNSTALDSYSHTEYVGMVIGNLTGVIKEIYKSGGRKFSFISLGSLGCLSSIRVQNPKGGCIKEASALAKLHNKELSKVLHKLEKQLQGFKYSNTKVYNFLRQAINRPMKYGFKEGKSACCGAGPFRGIQRCGVSAKYQLCDNPSEYIFWDNGHPTERTYRYVAEQMWSGNPTMVLYENGDRKFGFLGLSPLGCLPALRAMNPKANEGGCFEEASALALAHDNALTAVLTSLEYMLKGFKYCNSNFYNWLNDRIQNPSKFGFREGVNASCGTGPFWGIFSCGGTKAVAEYQLCDNVDDHIWWDSFHPTERIHEQFAKALWSGPPSSVGPYSLENLFFNQEKFTIIADIVDEVEEESY